MKKKHIKDPGSAITHFIGMLMAIFAAFPLLIKAAHEPSRIRKLAQATAAGVRMRPGRVYMMEFKVIFVIGIVVERIMDGNS